MSFNSKLTDRGRTIQAIEWYKSYYHGVLNEIFIAVAGTTEWSDDSNPDAVVSSVTALSELIGISKASVDFITPTVQSGADIVYADGTYWDKVTPTDPNTEDYTNILSQGLTNLYIETVISFDQFTLSNTFRKLAVCHNPQDLVPVLATNSSYNASEITSQGELKMIGHSSKIILVSGQSLNVGVILEF